MANFDNGLLELCSRWLDSSWDWDFMLTAVDNNKVTVRLRGVRPTSQPPLFAFDGIVGQQQARNYQGWHLWLPREELPPCADGEYFYADLERCVLTWQGEPVASVCAVIEAGPTVLLEVDRLGKLYLLPFVAHFVGEVNIELAQIELKQFWILE